MANQRYETGKAPVIEIVCPGDLAIRATIESSVLVRGSEHTATQHNGMLSIAAIDALSLTVPQGASIVVKGTVGGDCSIKGIDGTLDLSEIDGDLAIATIQGAVNIGSAHRDVAIRNLGNDLHCEMIDGDLALKGVGSVRIGTVEGDCAIRNANGDVEILNIGTDVSLNSVMGTVMLKDVDGDCHLSNLAGSQITVNANDDIRLIGPLGPGKHVINAKSTLHLRWPEPAPVHISADSPSIRNRLAFDTVTEEDGSLVGTIGEGDVTLTLSADEQITLRPLSQASSEGGTRFEFDFSFDDFGSMISSEIGARMAGITEEIERHFGSGFSSRVEEQAERAASRAQKAAERAVKKAEQAIRQAERRVNQPTPPRRPAKPPTPPQPPTVDTSQEQLLILKMLEQGKISMEEANRLLEALS